MNVSTRTTAAGSRISALLGALGVAALLSCTGTITAAAHAETPPPPIVVDDGGMVLGTPPIASGADLMVRAAYQSHYTGNYSRGPGQRMTTLATTPGQRVIGYFRACNLGAPPVMTLAGTRGNAAFGVRYSTGGADVTRAVVAGTFHVRLADGGCSRIKIVVLRRPSTPTGKARTFTLSGTVRNGEPDHAAFRVLAQPGGVPMRTAS